MRLRTIISLFLTLFYASAMAETVTVTGVVRDSLTREPIPFATVMLRGTDRGTLTDDDGRYTITTAIRWDSIQASTMGYDSKTLPAKKGDRMRIDFDLHSTGLLLNTVIAKPKREHYSKKTIQPSSLWSAYAPPRTSATRDARTTTTTTSMNA